MLPSPVCRAALVAAAGLLSTTLTLAGPAQPALASPGCLTETGAALGCDDTTPPALMPGDVSINVANGTATVTAMATHVDADPDPITYVCALDQGAFGGCGPYSGLTAGDHTLTVRAVDSHDEPITACEVVCEPFYVEAAPDYTELSKPFTVTPGGTSPPAPGPGGAPETQISGGPVDRITPGSPVTLSRKVLLNLASSEPGTFNCAVNARKVPCQAGANMLKKLRPGAQVFVAQAVDRDGNFDATPATTNFFVPTDLSPGQGRGWGKVRSRGSYAGDYVSTTTKGAVLTLDAVRGIHELRLFAPTGPELGKLAVRVGNGRWHKIELTSSRSDALTVFQVMPPGSGAASGRVQIKALKVPSGGAVAVDAVVAR